MIWLIALAGGLGAVARAGVDRLATLWFPAWTATLTVNLLGSFALGAASAHLDGAAFAVVGAGFCGGFTTFSSAGWQAARELGRRRVAFAVGYTAVTVAGCLTAVWLGLATA